MGERLNPKNCTVLIIRNEVSRSDHYLGMDEFELESCGLLEIRRCTTLMTD